MLYLKSVYKKYFNTVVDFIDVFIIKHIITVVPQPAPCILSLLV